MKDKLNFLPEDYLEKKAQQRTNIICLFLFLLVAGGVGTCFTLVEKRQQKMRKLEAEVNQKMNRASENLQQFETLETKKKQMMSKASISALLMEPVPRSLLLATITNNLPGSVSLLDYKLTSKEIIDKSANKNNKKINKLNKKKKNKKEKKPALPKKLQVQIEFVGLAQTDMEVAKLIANLNQSDLFSQVNLAFSKEHEMEDAMIRHFKIVTELDPKVKAGKDDVEWARKSHVKGF